MAASGMTTTVRVKTSTRDRLTSYGQQADLTADEVILAGLRALEVEQRRRRAEHEATLLAHDQAYLDEMAAVQADLHAAG